MMNIFTKNNLKFPLRFLGGFYIFDIKLDTGHHDLRSPLAIEPHQKINNGSVNPHNAPKQNHSRVVYNPVTQLFLGVGMKGCKQYPHGRAAVRHFLSLGRKVDAAEPNIRGTRAQKVVYRRV